MQTENSNGNSNLNVLMQFYLCKTKWWPAGSFPQALPQGLWFAFNQQKSNLKFYNKIDFSISK